MMIPFLIKMVDVQQVSTWPSTQEMSMSIYKSSMLGVKLS